MSMKKFASLVAIIGLLVVALGASVTMVGAQEPEETATEQVGHETTSEPDVYVVQEGDTYESIAEALGVSVEALLEANGLDGSEELTRGQELVRPEPAAEETPTEEATPEPTEELTAEPTEEATPEPIEEATPESTEEPTENVTPEPTEEATPEPTAEPTEAATEEPVPSTEESPPTGREGEPESTAQGEIGAQALTNIPFTSRVAVMDIGGAGADFTLSYYDQTGAAQGSGSYSVGKYQMRIINQASDPNLSTSTLKGSGIIESSNPVGAAVFFGGTSGGYKEYDAYESGGVVQPNTKFYLPNAFRNVPGGGFFKSNSEIAIMNADSSTAAVVDVYFVADDKTRSITVQPKATYYYNLEQESLISNGIRQPAVFTSRNGQAIMVLSTQYAWADAGYPVFVTHTPGFRVSDASSKQYLPNIMSRLLNGYSVVHFVQNVGSSPVDITVTYKPDPACVAGQQGGACAPGNIVKKAQINANEVFAVNPRIGELPAQWFGSAAVTTDDNSASIVAFTNQINWFTGNTSGVVSRSAENSGTTLYCPYFISGYPTFSASSSGSAMQIQNVSGANDVQVRVTFYPGLASPSTASPSPTTLTLDDGERYNFNCRLSSCGGLPSNWYGSVVIESVTPGAEIAGIVNLFDRNVDERDALGSYNCISPAP